MPFARASPRAPAGPQPPLTIRLIRFAGTAIIAFVIVACLALMAVRFVVFPLVESRRTEIAALLSARIGEKVEIDAIATGWDGWNPRLTISGLRIRDKAGALVQPLVELPEVDFVVSWTSLPALDLRLRELEVTGPRLAIRRDRQGRIHVAGIAFDPDETVDDTSLTDWLLRQREITVRDALITWNDDLRNAPQLVLDRVQFRLEHTFGHHRFGLTGVPPAELAGPIDIRGDLTGLTQGVLQKTDGRLYFQLDYADIAAWREWIALPIPVESGKGALRLWSDVVAGQPREAVADLVLADVRARLRKELPPLEFATLSGRVGWKQDGNRREIYAKKLGFQAGDGLTLPPMDLTLAYSEDAEGRPLKGTLSFDRLELAPLTALATQLPLPDNVRRNLARYAPRGSLAGGKLAWDSPTETQIKFTASGEFHDLGVTAQDLFPGASGVSGSFEASETRGLLRLASKALTVDLPKVFAERIVLDTAGGTLRWERTPDTLKVKVEDLAFANGYAAGTASGSWQSLPNGPGQIDMKAQFTRANIAEMHRYLPLQFDPHVRDWVRHAVTRGTSNDGRIVLAGNLADFPFPQGKNGQFLLTVKGQGGGLDYAERWPPISDIEANLRVEGTRLTLDALHGRVLGADIGRTHAEIPDMADAQPVVKITGDATGPTSEFLAFIDQSPIDGWTEHFNDGVTTSGNGRLALRFDLPLSNLRATTVAGEYQFLGNQARVPGLPALTGLQGKLEFTEHALSSTDLVADALGGSLKLGLSGGDGRLRVSASGTSTIAALRREYDLPLPERVAGTAEWQLVANVRPGGSAVWSVESSLKGVSIDAPAPLGKAADEIVRLKVERREPPPRARDESLALDYGGVARLTLRKSATPNAAYDRGLLLVGKAIERGGEPDRPGLWLRADLPTINVDDWLAFARSLPPAGTPGSAPAAAPGPATAAPPGAAAATPLEFRGADLAAAQIQVIGRRFNDLAISARRESGDWRVALDGREVKGTATWRDATPDLPNGRVTARLARLNMPGPGDLVAWQGGPAEAPLAAGAANPWPEIDVSTQSFVSKDRDLGSLDFLARPQGTDWHIEKLVIANDAGRIDADGWWRTGRAPQTQMNVAIDAHDAGGFLARFGTPGAVTGAPTRIEGKLAWAGSPSDFDYPSLSGTLKLVAGSGQFLKAEPGMGRLLGVLSLQALPRRVTLDFRDVFSEGFAFDSVTGTARVDKGVMHTDNLKLVGPAAAVDISGAVDLGQETEDLRVRVLPALSTSISVGAAALFIANPLVGAAVGAGTLLAQKILKDPMEQLFSYEYTVTGSWADPVVARVGSRTAAVGAPVAAK